MAALTKSKTAAKAQQLGTRPGAQSWIVLGMLCFVYVLNFLDRSLLSILAKPIQDTLHITDGQLGLIGGLYFALFYCFISIPVGWLADRTNRVWVLTAACAIWSAATMACGVASNYTQLAVARMTVGFGEAGGVPPSYAIISDYFPSGKRGTALGIYNLGPPIGAALGIAFGASIAAAYSWRDAFIVLGGAGLVSALLIVLVVREPVRGGLDSHRGDMETPASSFWQTIVMYFSRPSLVLAAVASGVTQIITYGSGNFSTLFVMREKGMTMSEVALYSALVVGFGMGSGILVSGYVIDRFTKISKQAYALIPAASLALAIPFFLGFVWSPTWQVALLFLIGPTFLNFFYLSSSVTLVQEEVRPDQRVMSGALLLLVMNFTGMGVGPAFVGAMSDHFHINHPEHSLQLAFYCLAPFYVLAILLFLWLARVLKKESEEAQ
ncbi:MAG TPA: MFS transporter [Rhizomicrobium sp.]|jgi:predicted MFS family arabinose efflux permease|nr:MFS transporter [Rhizomicrobium sp.]